ncbi:MAG: hypothetical protein ACI4I7_05510, partial [Oscillospiraceae bacterium]
MIQLIDKDTKIPDGIDIVNGNFTEMQEQYDSVTDAVNQAKTFRNQSETYYQAARSESDYAKECADNAKQYASSVSDSVDQIEKNKQNIAKIHNDLSVRREGIEKGYKYSLKFDYSVGTFVSTSGENLDKSTRI